jgi:hypothetical protein
VPLSDIFSGLQLVTAPSIEPVTLAAAKTHLRISSSFTADDSYITFLITFVRQQAETVLRRALLTQQWVLSLKNWPGRDFAGSQGLALNPGQFDRYDHIKIPLPPLQSVQTVNYYDTAGNLNTMPQGGQLPSSPPATNINLQLPGSYNVMTANEPGRIVLPFSQIWPTVILLPGAPIEITFTCGYPDIPTLKATFEGYHATYHAILMLVGYFYENRVPPTEMRKSNVPAGTQLVFQEILEPFIVRDM